MRLFGDIGGPGVWNRGGPRGHVMELPPTVPNQTGWPLEDKPTSTAPQHLVCRVVQSLHTNHRISIIEASIC